MLVAQNQNAAETSSTLYNYGGSEAGFDSLKIISFDKAFNSVATGLQAWRGAWGGLVGGVAVLAWAAVVWGYEGEVNGLGVQDSMSKDTES